MADLGYDIEWRCFLRVQAKEEKSLRMFDHPEKHPSGLAALCAYHYLCKSKDPHTDAFHRAVLGAYHEHNVDINDIDQLGKIAADLGIDAAAIADAAVDRSVIRDVAAEHEDAVLAHGVTDTPTIVSKDGQTLYVRLGAPPEDEVAARRVVKSVIDIALSEPAIRELRRT